MAELRTVNFIDALVAVLTLQNTLIMVEGTAADGSAMLPLTAVSSGAIYAVIVAVTIRMLQKGLARTKQAEKANAPGMGKRLESEAAPQALFRFLFASRGKLGAELS